MTSTRWSTRSCGGGRLRGASARTLLALALVLTGACREGVDPAKDVALRVSWEPAPASVGPTTFTLDLETNQGQPISGAAIEVEGNMSHAGMVPEFGEAREVSTGRYEVELELTMGGDWFLLLEIELPDGRVLERTWDVPGVSSRRGP